jgi:hypothetical protein
MKSQNVLKPEKIFLVNQRFSNQFIFLYFRSSSHLSKLTHYCHFSVSEGLQHHFQNEPENQNLFNSKHIVYFEPLYFSFLYFIIQFCSNEVLIIFSNENIFVVECKMLLLLYLCIWILKLQASWFRNLKYFILSTRTMIFNKNHFTSCVVHVYKLDCLLR